MSSASVAVTRPRRSRTARYAREELRDRRLAGAGVADEGDRRPRGDVEVDPVEHLGPVAVAEAQPLELHVAVDASQLARGGTVLHLGLLVHDVHDLVERRDR